MKPLIDIGNPDAPRGSEPWCRSFHQAICRLKREGQFAVSNLKYSLRDFRDGKHFTQLTDVEGKPFKTWDNFVRCREPYGLGMRPDVARTIINEKDDTKLLRDVLGKRGRPKKGEEKGDNITLKERGTSRAYILARLDRDGHAELAAKVREGTMSANAAAIEAGFRKQPTPIGDAHKVLAKLTDIQWEKLKRDEDQRRHNAGLAA